MLETVAAPAGGDAAIDRRLGLTRATLADEWRAASPHSPGEIARFYREARGLKADLDAWHALAWRQRVTAMVVAVARQVGARSTLDVGCGAGHDLKALRDAGIPITVGVEPNDLLRSGLRADGFHVAPDVAGVKVEDADLLLCLDVLEHVPDPEAFLRDLATRARANAVLCETVATHDLATPLHLRDNWGWHPGRVLEQAGWACIDTHERLRVWQRLQPKGDARASVLLCGYRAVSMPTAVCLSRLTAKGWRLNTCEGDALVSRARSRAVSRWWAETGDDVFLMIDDDIVFETWHAERLVQLCRDGLDVACAAYPTHNGHHLALRLADSTVSFGPDQPPLPITYAATGFMAVRRAVIDALVPTLPLCQPWSFWPLFAPFVVTSPQGVNDYLSEDYAFCQRARDKGFGVWLDPTIKLGHLSQITLDVQNMAKVHGIVGG